MSSQDGSEWILVELAEDLEKPGPVDASTQTDFAVDGAATSCSPPKHIGRTAKFYVVWHPKHLAGIYIGEAAWGVILRALGEPYKYTSGHRLCRRESLEAAQETYDSETDRHEVPPEPIYFDCQ